jgi:hypothetical protein
MKSDNKLLAKKYFQDAIRYFHNAKEKLQKAKVDYYKKIYTDTKPVVEACGLGYRAVLKALDGYLILRGIEESKLPESYYGYLDILKKYLVHNGKVKTNLDIVYRHLHIYGYYRDCVTVSIVKEGFESAKFIIEKLSGNKV